MLPHLTAGGTVFGGQTVVQYVKYGEDHPRRQCDFLNLPLSCGGIVLSYRLGPLVLKCQTYTPAPRNVPQQNVDEQVQQSAFWIMG
jgi:hypothetical protein